jgi:hypothetical protein
VVGNNFSDCFHGFRLCRHGGVGWRGTELFNGHRNDIRMLAPMHSFGRERDKEDLAVVPNISGKAVAHGDPGAGQARD